MKNHLSTLLFIFMATNLIAQTNPAITNWIINTTGVTGRHYISGNSTPINDSYLANVETVQYSNNFSYISASGIPSYIVGPYLDGNPNQAGDNNHIFKIPLNPVPNTGAASTTHLGSIGVFINGVSIFDWRDGMSYQNQGVWNRNAVINEMDGFDCAKGHPAGIQYHHHQNPTAFNLDLVEVSDVCDLYLADGLYVIDASEHSPLIGFSYDGYPVYGAYAYANTDGSGGLKRMEPSWQPRNITVRTHYADGTNVTDGPPVNATYPIGNYVEDYEYIAGSGDLDEFNGRFAVTPEYPDGIYAYYATVDANWNSAFPYLIGPYYYYGEVTGGSVNNITETVTTYDPGASICTVSVSTSGTNVSTAGGSDGNATATVSGGQGSITYAWSNGESNAMITAIPAGNYTVTITDNIEAGCTATSTITITEPQPPSCTLSATTSGTNVSTYGGSDGNATATVSGAQGNITYAWSNGETTSMITAIPAGIYTVTVTDDIVTNCTAISNTTITEPAPPACPENQTVTGTIPTQLFQVSNNITATGTVPPGNNVIFKADHIDLNADFEVVLDGEFLAEIDPCEEPPLMNHEIVAEDFNQTSLVSFNMVSCLLENGSTTTCFELVFSSNPLPDGPYCPTTVNDTGGLGIYDGNTNPGLNVLDGTFFNNMELDNYDIVDNAGNIRIFTFQGPPPNISFSNCMEPVPNDNLQLTFLIPATPELLAIPANIAIEEFLGLTFDGTPIHGPTESVRTPPMGAPGNIWPLDPCGGHYNIPGFYHMHFIAEGMSQILSNNNITNSSCSNVSQSATAWAGLARDGHPIYSYSDATGIPNDLDACNGHFGTTPEYPLGIYHYHASATSSPNVPPCLAGAAATNAFSYQ